MKPIDALWRDIVFATRLLRKSPIFTAAIVLTLALGVGVNTALFSVVNAFLLRPLPVRDADRLVVIATEDRAGRTLGAVSFSDLQDYRAATSGVFEEIAGYSVGFLGLAPEAAPPARVLVTWVTGSYFPLLGVRPFLGRLIRADEGERGRTDPVVVLGYATWQRRFRGDRSVVGKVVRVNGQPSTIVGVAPPDFVGTFAFSESELFLPVTWHGPGDLDNRQARGLHAIARLRPDVSLESAQSAMNVVAEVLTRQYPSSNTNVGVRVLPERLARPEENQFRTNVSGAAVMLGMVGLVMIVAAVNVTNLVLARAAARRRELAIRAALGAGRLRLVRQLVTESLMMAALGGSIGILAGAWTAQALASIRLPGDLPVRFDFHLDGRVLAYTAMVAGASGLFVGLVPALRIGRADLENALRQPGQGSRPIHGYRLPSVLMVAQIALSVLLLVAAGLFGRSLFEAERADLGFRPDGVLNVHMDVGQLGYTEAQGRALFEEIEQSIGAIPGVRHVSFAFTIPMGYVRASEAVEAEGRASGSGERMPAGKNLVGPEYFQTMGIELVQGRSFSDEYDERSRPVAIVNQRLAGMLWPGQAAIGRRFRPVARSGPWIEVVGVVGTGKYQFLFEDAQPYFYLPIAQEYTGLRVLQVRTSVAPESVRPAVERAIGAREPNLPLYDIQSMAQALGSGPGLFPARVGAVAIATFGLLAFALAIVGLYGLVSYLASQRSHEIGVRMAVGATSRDVVCLVLRDGLAIVLCGLAAGLALALGSSRVVGHLLFGVSARDPLTLLVVAPIVGCAAMLACTLPAWRAARTDPVVALRSE